jgi:[ribosomal protein S5]-alanine N-acetyltransferase
VPHNDRVAEPALRQAAPPVSIAVTLWREPGGAGALMTEVLTEVMNWALNQPGIFRIGAVCDVENIGSAPRDGKGWVIP